MLSRFDTPKKSVHNFVSLLLTQQNANAAQSAASSEKQLNEFWQYPVL